MCYHIRVFILPGWLCVIIYAFLYCQCECVLSYTRFYIASVTVCYHIRVFILPGWLCVIIYAFLYCHGDCVLSYTRFYIDRVTVTWNGSLPEPNSGWTIWMMVAHFRSHLTWSLPLNRSCTFGNVVGWCVPAQKSRRKNTNERLERLL